MRHTLRPVLPVLLVLLLPAITRAANPTFDIRTVAATGERPSSLRTADFDKDGAPDLAVLTSTGVAVFFNDSRGNFTRVDLTASQSGSLQVADFDGDGRLDIAVATNTQTFTNPPANHPIVLFLNNGNRTFRTVSATTPQWTGFSFAAADINGDGKADLALAFNNKTVSVMLGNGDGTFQSPRDVYTVTPSPRATDPSIYALQGTFIAGDFNGDGRQEIAFSEGPFSVAFGGANITVLFNQGNLVFTRTQFEEGNFSSPVLLDGNGDGIDDLGFTWAACHTPCHGADVWTGSSADTMNQLIIFGTSTVLQSLAYSPVSADFDGDGSRDVAFAMAYNQGRNFPPESVHESVLMFLGPNIPKLAPPPDPVDYNLRQLSQSSFGAASMVTADFNLDGKPDIAVVADSNPDVITLMLNTSQGNFPPAPRDFALTVSPTAATVKAGNPATFNVTISRLATFSDSVSFSCTGLPANAACNFSPASVAPDNTGTGMTTLTITTKAPGSAALMPFWYGGGAFAFLLPLVGLFIIAPSRSNVRRGVLLVAMIAATLILFQACGGGSSKTNTQTPSPTTTPPSGGSGTPGGGGTTTGGSTTGGGTGSGTPAGAYTINVVATSGGATTITHSQTLTLTVQ